MEIVRRGETSMLACQCLDGKVATAGDGVKIDSYFLWLLSRPKSKRAVPPWGAARLLPRPAASYS